MFEDLRKSASENYKEIEEEEAEDFDLYDYDEDYDKPKPPRRFLGMTAPQRFVLALMLFFMSCILGSFFLILTGKIVLPIF